MKIRYAKNLIRGNVETQTGGTEGNQTDLDVMRLNMIGDGSNGLTANDIEVGWEEETIISGWAKSFTDSLKTYADRRKAEYDQLNQFEMQFDDQRDGTTTWVDAINDIKNKYPKE